MLKNTPWKIVMLYMPAKMLDRFSSCKWNFPTFIRLYLLHFAFQNKNYKVSPFHEDVIFLLLHVYRKVMIYMVQASMQARYTYRMFTKYLEGKFREEKYLRNFNRLSCFSFFPSPQKPKVLSYCTLIIRFFILTFFCNIFHLAF